MQYPFKVTKRAKIIITLLASILQINLSAVLWYFPIDRSIHLVGFLSFFLFFFLSFFLSFFFLSFFLSFFFLSFFLSFLLSFFTSVFHSFFLSFFFLFLFFWLKLFSFLSAGLCYVRCIRNMVYHSLKKKGKKS